MNIRKWKLKFKRPYLYLYIDFGFLSVKTSLMRYCFEMDNFEYIALGGHLFSKRFEFSLYKTRVWEGE